MRHNFSSEKKLSVTIYIEITHCLKICKTKLVVFKDKLTFIGLAPAGATFLH